DEIGVFERALADHDQASHSEPNKPGIFHDRRTHTRMAATKRHLATLKRFAQASPDLAQFTPIRRVHRASTCPCGKHFHAAAAPSWTARKYEARHVSQRMLHRQLLRTGQS